MYGKHKYFSEVQYENVLRWGVIQIWKQGMLSFIIIIIQNTSINENGQRGKYFQ